MMVYPDCNFSATAIQDSLHLSDYKTKCIDGEFEIFFVDSEIDALLEAYSLEDVHGTLLSLDLIDENYDLVKTIF